MNPPSLSSMIADNNFEEETEEQSNENHQEQPERKITLNGTSIFYTFINGRGHIASRDLHKEFRKLRKNIDPSIYNIIVDHTPITWGLEPQAKELKAHTGPDDRQNITTVSISDAFTGIEFMLQHSNNEANGMKLFGPWGGMIHITWLGGKITSPYITIRKAKCIPIKIVQGMVIPNTEGVPSESLTGWDKAALLIELYKYRGEIYDNTTYNDLRVVSLDKIQFDTGICLHVHEI